MAGGTDGQIITYDASGDPIAIGPGTDGQVLTSTGAGSPPAFEDAAGGGSSVGGATGVDFDDDVKVRFGDDQDLDVWHDGSNGYVDISTGYLYIKDETNSKYIAKLHGSWSQEFYFNNSKKLEVNNTGIGVTGSITPSGGIYLGGSGGSNYLNDYEEGTWTPAPDGLSNTPGWSNRSGKYTKIGRIVHVTAILQPTGTLPTFTTTTDILKVAGLPFTATGVTYTLSLGTVSHQSLNWAGSGNNESNYADDAADSFHCSIEDSTKSVFHVCSSGDNRSRVRNAAINSDDFILEWEMTYST